MLVFVSPRTIRAIYSPKILFEGEVTRFEIILSELRSDISRPEKLDDTYLRASLLVKPIR